MGVAVASERPLVLPLERDGHWRRYRVRGLRGNDALAAWIERQLHDSGRTPCRASAHTGIVRIDGTHEVQWQQRLEQCMLEFDPIAGTRRPTPAPAADEQRSAPRGALTAEARNCSARADSRSIERKHRRLHPLRQPRARRRASTSGRHGTTSTGPRCSVRLAPGPKA